MKRFLCLTLMLCILLCFSACKNTTAEEDFPNAVEPILPEITGTRLPFKTLCTGGAKDEAEGGMMIWYTQEEAREGLELLWLLQDEKDTLLQKNFDLYALAVVSLTKTSSSANIGKLAEVILGEHMTIVYVSEQPDPAENTSDIIIPTTVILLQKKDIVHLERGENNRVQHMRLRYNTCYPERGISSF